MLSALRPRAGVARLTPASVVQARTVVSGHRNGACRVGNEAPAPAGSSAEPIISRRFIVGAVQAAADAEPIAEQELIGGEPLLSSYLRDGVLAVLGKLALAGAGPALVENVAEDLFRLLSVAANATRDAYRSLLDGLLPHADLATTKGRPSDAPPPVDGTPDGTS